MSKIKCSCGSAVIDQTDGVPNKGAIIRDQDRAGLFQSMVRDISSFMGSASVGMREKWITENYLKYDQDDCPALEVTDAQVIEFILLTRIAKELNIYQCPACGSVMIETEPFSNKFAIFAASDWKPFDASILQAAEGAEGPTFKLLG